MGIVGRVGRRLRTREAQGWSLDDVPEDLSARPGRAGEARRRLGLPVEDGTRGRPESRLRLVKGSLRLPTEVESVAVGRRWLRDVLGREFGDGHPVIGDAVQALSEILANAVLYGAGLHVRVSYEVDGTWVEVAVRNDGRPDGRWPQRQAPAAPDAESGRGLEMVEAFSDQWASRCCRRTRSWSGSG
ncbi:ATP-binding protein [Actinomadura soli]|uniref:ATP-binding protein n=1 Tax=Actinomadura soli TaxID=2508997 RepID=A0A5C4IZR8_9ACTN|nr:ATP-binding protein [Actinomadura soli]TMQ89817.1 ATP-binding protein [Actinomadura soli]